MNVKAINPDKTAARQSLVAKLADRYGVDPEKFLATLKATAFKQRPRKDGSVIEVSNEQMMALLVVADQYGLNPFTKEIYAFPDERGGITPIVSIDGWVRIINEKPTISGIEFTQGTETNGDGAEDHYIECTISRSDRVVPVTVREYFKECYRDTGPWNSHPRRMLRHKALIQCARVAFGFGGIYDPDEADRIAEAQAVEGTVVKTKPKTAPPRAIAQAPAEEPIVPVVIPEQQPEPVPVQRLSQTDARLALLKLSDASGVPLKEIEKKVGSPLEEASADALNAAIEWVHGLNA